MEQASPYTALIAADADIQRSIQRHHAQSVLQSTEHTSGMHLDRSRERVLSMSEQEVTKLAASYYECGPYEDYLTMESILQEIVLAGLLYTLHSKLIHTHAHLHINA
jgi:hypothetical protein